MTQVDVECPCGQRVTVNIQLTIAGFSYSPNRCAGCQKKLKVPRDAFDRERQRQHPNLKR